MPVVVKSADEGRNTTTTFADDSELSIALGVGTYLIDVMAIFSGASAASVKFQLAFSGTATKGMGYLWWNNARSGSTGGSSTGRRPWGLYSGEGLSGNGNIIGLSRATACVDGNNQGVYHMRFVLVTSAGGNLSLQWAQNVSNGTDTVVWAGSSIAYWNQNDMPDGETLIVKPTTTSRTLTTTVAADPHLTLTMSANKHYLVEMMVAMYGGSVPDGKFALSFPSIQRVRGFNWMQANSVQTTTSEPGATLGFCSPFDATLHLVERGFAGSGTTTQRFSLAIKALMTPGPSPVTFDFMWSQTASSATATQVFTPSWIHYKEIDA